MRLGQAYFAAQALAGVLWWVAVFASEMVRSATLGGLDPVLLALADIPLFAGASAVAATGNRVGLWIATGWTVLVAAGMALYATLTGEAGWGALLMLAAGGGSVVAALLIVRGSIPTRWLIAGPFRFRTAPRATVTHYVLWTLGQLVLFWSLFLVILPAVIVLIEHRWGLWIPFPFGLRVFGLVALLLFSALGLWSAFAISRNGRGTPLPMAMPTALVTTGPYRWVRNPMALAGIGQGVAVGLSIESWLVVLYALLGSAIWNWAVRPHEEANLLETFGVVYTDYQSRVRCWIPTFRASAMVPKG
ncbi:protein-S-isoprenylcysteine O-methyltransferase Ste14 [Leifsonia sp. AK011]|uniref:methyltransferase family protein n=1 Tax=Leifsonia sp. AK011 TaxID=2723075 RepID=UPI001851A915|nr:isoprenylcysteine carboxylmethyltransferase family protein [Leifsonia sp. AK011]NYF11353.1 protein-S-isoprenylcysteine O-methyltransferase Ste14 [Leifsonia sp. AK011]